MSGWLRLTKKYLFAEKHPPDITIFLIIIYFFIMPSVLQAQIKQSHSIIASFLQIKDAFNLGMVFNGVQLGYKYNIQWTIGESELRFQPNLAIGVAFNRGMTAWNVNFDPIDFSWVRTFYKQDGHIFKAGANFAANYGYQMYPDLHSGHLFWVSEIGLSPRAEYTYQWDKKRIVINAQNSLLGFVSHTRKNDPYFYSFKAGDFFARPYEDMRFGSFNNYNHSDVSLEFMPDVSKHHSFLLGFDYLASFYDVQFRRLNYNVQWKISL